MIIKVWQERHQGLDNPEQQISITTADLEPILKKGEPCRSSERGKARVESKLGE